MVLEYFGFSEEPFGATPDPRWLYRSDTHREALACLRYGFQSNRGFTALIAPPGMGKTTLLYQFLGDIQKSALSAFVFDGQCDPPGLLRYILRDLGLAPAINCVEMHEQLKEVLVKEARAGRKVVVVVDEAQNLSEEPLEMLRLLTNFETPQTKLLQIILAGQPALADKLARPSLEQLRQRISTISLLEPFSIEETTAYIRHRLERAGYRGAPLFRRDALNQITSASHGIPRIINTLCFNALSLCCALKLKQVDGSIAAEVIADQELDRELRKTALGRVKAVAKQPLQSEPTPRFEESKPAVRVTKLLAVTAGVTLIVSGLSLLSYVPHWQPWPRLMRHLQSLGKTVYSASVPAPTAANTGADSVDQASSKSKPFQITVEPNQTLHDISLRYLGTWNLRRLHQIQALNPKLADVDHIEAGQKVWLPPPGPTVSGSNVSQRANAGDRHEP